MLHEAYEKALQYASLREQINGKQVAPEGEQEVSQYESSGGRTDEGEIPFEGGMQVRGKSRMNRIERI